jgi:hypothetical protein
MSYDRGVIEGGIRKVSGLYDSSWKGLVTEASIGHPAKCSHGLITWIFNYLIDNGYLHKGDICCDPFGGIFSTGIIGAGRGIKVVGVELEQRFYDIAQDNIKLHTKLWEACGDPVPVLLKGDSRRLSEIIAPVLGKLASCIVGSPPFAEQQQGGGLATSRMTASGEPIGKADGYVNQGVSPGQLGAMPAGDVSAIVGSPPFLGARSDTTKSGPTAAGGPCADRNDTAIADYGSAEGQLGNMPSGEVAAIIGSPPFANQNDHERPPDSTRSKQGRDAICRPYGETPGQLGTMREGDVAAIVGSPPFLDPRGAVGRNAQELDCNRAGYAAGITNEFGETNGQLSMMKPGELPTAEPTAAPEATKPKAKRKSKAKPKPDKPHVITFWEASADILRQCYQILKPGGACVWVVKAFVRKNKLVDFPGDWRRLSEFCGFEFVEEIHAMQVRTHEQPSLFGDPPFKKVAARMGFFRRNHLIQMRAAKYWGTLNEYARAPYLAEAGTVWQEGIDKMPADSDAARKQRTNAMRRKDRRVLQMAQSLALKAYPGDQSDWKTELEIDHEVVLVMRKPVARSPWEADELCVGHG